MKYTRTSLLVTREFQRRLHKLILRCGEIVKFRSYDIVTSSNEKPKEIDRESVKGIDAGGYVGSERELS